MLNATTNEAYTRHAEKRDYHRMQVELDVEFEVMETNQLGGGTTVNLSTRGICISTTTPVTAGQTLDVVVHGGTAAWKPLKATATVIRSDKINDQYEVACSLHNVQ